MRVLRCLWDEKHSRILRKSGRSSKTHEMILFFLRVWSFSRRQTDKNLSGFSTLVDAGVEKFQRTKNQLKYNFPDRKNPSTNTTQSHEVCFGEEEPLAESHLCLTDGSQTNLKKQLDIKSGFKCCKVLMYQKDYYFV